MKSETKLLFGGLLLSGLGFFSLLYIGNIWLALFVVLVIAIIFLGRLLSLSEGKFESKWAYRLVYGLGILIVLSNAISFAHDYGKRNYQKDFLLEIRKTIESGIAKTDVREKFVYALAQHHLNESESIVETFRDLMPEYLGDNGIYLVDAVREMAQDSSNTGEIKDHFLNYFYEINEEADELKVIVVSKITEGKNPDYENYDGQIGRTEMRFKLKKEGTSFEILN